MTDVFIQPATSVLLTEGTWIIPPAIARFEHVTLGGELGVPVGEEFARLAAAWRSAVRFSSSLTEAFEHPAYQAIIALGAAVVPVLLRDLARSPDHWGFALRCITGENPVPPRDAGRIDRTAQAWIQWGAARGLIG